MNLSVRTPETLAAGAADHVCELQLILRCFADLKCVITLIIIIIVIIIIIIITGQMVLSFCACL